MSEIVINKVYEILKDCAKKSRTIDYGYLYEQIGVDSRSIAERNRGSLILEEVNNLSIDDNNVMITALAVEKGTGLSGKGFFDLAERLGRINKAAEKNEKIDFWNKECQKIYSLYTEGSIGKVLKYVALNYLEQKKQPFSNNKFAEYIRRDSVKIFEKIIDDEDLLITASSGKGVWAEIPWIVIYNKKETDGPQEGLYIAYLFSADMKRIYLCLAYGVTKMIERYGKKLAFEKILSKIITVRSRGFLQGYLSDKNINLASGGRGHDYERAVVFYKQYVASDLPSEITLKEDLKNIINYYSNCLVEDNIVTEGVDFKNYTGGVEEGRLNLINHYSRERSPKIIRAAKEFYLKKNGKLECVVCGFNFQNKYGERGANFIEAHHMKPVSIMKDGDITRIEDIALLCSNCHKMIHVKSPWISIDDLKEIINN